MSHVVCGPEVEPWPNEYREVGFGFWLLEQWSELPGEVGSPYYDRCSETG